LGRRPGALPLVGSQRLFVWVFGGLVARQGGRVGELEGTVLVRALVLLVLEVSSSVHGHMLVLVELLATHIAREFTIWRVPGRLVSGHVTRLRFLAGESALPAVFKHEGTLPPGRVGSGSRRSSKEPAVARDVFTIKLTLAGFLTP